jgi:Legionella pneumophila major outer membrane protein precursor
MLNLKKTALAVLALGSTAAFAGTMGPVCSAVNVTVPCENTAWDLGGRALYVQTTGVPAVGQSSITVGNTTGTYGVNPQWSWGFQLEASYHYNTGNDFNLNWYHLRSDNSSATGASNFGSIYLPGEPIASTISITSASSNIATAWDTVNMEFGQHVDFGENKFARFHAGAAWTRVGDSGAVAFNGTISENAYNQTTSYSEVFNGFGPRVGTDLTYDWGNGLSIYGDGALGLLAGTAKSSNTTAGATFSISQTRVVPELDAKLGAMYTYAMAQGDLSLDVGWVWANYINSLTTLDDANTHDFGVQGLYFGLKWVGSVA